MHINNKITEQYKKAPVQVKAAFAFFICSLTQKLISVITTPIFTRLLTSSEYGEFSQFNSWSNIFSVIITLYITKDVFTQGIIKFEKDKQEYILSSQELCLLLCLIWNVFFLIFPQFWVRLTGLTKLQIQAMFIMIWTTAIFDFWAVCQRVEYKYWRLIIVTLSVSIVQPVCGIIAVSCFRDKVTARIISITLIQVIIFQWMFWGCIFNGKKKFSIKYWKYIISFNVPLVPHYMSQIILASFDKIMIGKMVNSACVGIYSLAYSVSYILTIFNSTLIQTMEPWIYKKTKEQKYSEISHYVYIAFAIVAIANLCLIAFAPEVIYIFAPKSYSVAAKLIPPLAMSVFFMFMYSFFAIFEFYYEETKMVTVASLLGAIMNVGLNYLLIPKWGYQAAAYTTLMCYILYAILHYIMMKRVCKIHNIKKIYDDKIIWFICVIFMGVGIILLLSYDCVLFRFVLILVSVITGICFRKKIINEIKKLISIRTNN